MYRFLTRFVWLSGILIPASFCPGFDFYQPVRPPRPFQVMVHRGARNQAPENTQPAIERAIDDGLEWVEVDVRLTRDGHHVLFHDERVDRTTNGSGRVKDLTRAELLELDAGSPFAPRYAGVRPMTLDQCLRLAKGRINLNIDCKDANPRRLVQQILEAGMARQVVVFDRPDNLKRIRDASQGKIAIQARWRRALGIDSWIQKLRPDAVEVDADQVTPAICKSFRENGILVQAKCLGPWDRPQFWDRAIEAGADWILTDVPEELIPHALWKRIPNRPVQMAMHRGASRYAPENTLPAFAKATRMGADFVEFDVRKTKDGAYYLLHDSKLDRTTNGTGPIQRCSSEVVASLDAGAWFGGPFVGTHVPTLDAFLAAVKDKTNLYFDAKAIPPQILADAVERYGMAERTIVYQSPAYLAKLKTINPRIRALPPLSHAAQLPILAARLKPYAVDTSWDVLSKKLIDRCHQLNIAVFSDAPGDARVEHYMRVIRWGIDLIQTDHPLRLMRAVERLETEVATSAPAAVK